jgi:hypothetical protein
MSGVGTSVQKLEARQQEYDSLLGFLGGLRAGKMLDH